MRLTLEQPKSGNDGIDVKNPKDERAPGQRLVSWNWIKSVVDFQAEYRHG